MQAKYDFSGKTALVIGGTTGIGRATALAFAESGANLYVAGLGAGEGRSLVDEINARHPGVAIEFAEVDVRSEDAVRNFHERAYQRFGRVDVAFNNAGVGASGFAVADEEEVAFSRLIDVNLKGIFLSMKYEIPAMLAAGGGTIVNTASVAGLVGERGIGAYAASKHGVVGLTRTAALDYIGQGIRINAVCPGATRTRILADWFQDPKVEEFILSRHPIGRIAEPEEIGRAVLFLASEDASFIVGQALAVDGGLTAQ